MGGRIYDPTIGRFLQADPFIQAPLNSQNYNRFSYVLNNPMSMTDPTGYNFLEKLARPFKNVVRSVFRAIGQTGSQWLVNIGSIVCGPYYAACVAAGNYDIARAFGADKNGALRGAAVAGITAYINGPPSSINIVQIAAEIIDPDVGRIVRFMQNGIDIETYKESFIDGLFETGTYAYYETKNYYVSKEFARFAHKNGMTLAELNALLTVGSLAGNKIAGSRYKGSKNRNSTFELINGIGQRRGQGIDLVAFNYDFAGLPFDIIDIVLGYQGLLTASAHEYLQNGNKGDLLVGYSLGALDVSNLSARGKVNNSLSISLPFGNVGMSSLTVNGTTDLVNGGILGGILTPNSQWEPRSLIDHASYNYDAWRSL